MTFEASEGTGSFPHPTNLREKLDDILSFLTTRIGPESNQWTVELDQNNGELPTSVNYVREVILSAPGSNGDPTPGNAVEFFVGIRIMQDNNAPRYEIRGYTGYNSGILRGPGDVDWDGQPNASPLSYVPETTVFTTPYWFFGNGRRFIMVNKISTSYSFMYLGYFNPIATQSEYPQPFIVSGCARLNTTLYTDTDLGEYSHMPVGCPNSAWVRWIDGSWLECWSRTSTANNESANDPNHIVMWPDQDQEAPTGGTTEQHSWHPVVGNPTSYSNAVGGTEPLGNWLHSELFLQSPGDEPPLFPIMMYGFNPQVRYYGEPDSVYSMNGVNQVPESTIQASVGGQTENFIIFPMTAQTLNRYWFAVREG